MRRVATGHSTTARRVSSWLSVFAALAVVAVGDLVALSVPSALGMLVVGAIALIFYLPLAALCAYAAVRYRRDTNLMVGFVAAACLWLAVVPLSWFFGGWGLLLIPIAFVETAAWIVGLRRNPR